MPQVPPDILSSRKCLLFQSPPLGEPPPQQRDEPRQRPQPPQDRLLQLLRKSSLMRSTLMKLAAWITTSPTTLALPTRDFLEVTTKTVRIFHLLPSATIIIILATTATPTPSDSVNPSEQNPPQLRQPQPRPEDRKQRQWPHFPPRNLSPSVHKSSLNPTVALLSTILPTIRLLITASHHLQVEQSRFPKPTRIASILAPWPQIASLQSPHQTRDLVRIIIIITIATIITSIVEHHLEHLEVFPKPKRKFSGLTTVQRTRLRTPTRLSSSAISITQNAPFAQVDIGTTPPTAHLVLERDFPQLWNPERIPSWRSAL